MATEQEKVINAIVKLIRGTQEGSITWSVKKQTTAPSLDPNEYVEPDIVYEADYKGRRLRLYEVYQRYEGRHYILKFVDDGGTTLWTFPEVSGLDDLLSSVRYQIADVKKFLDDLIGEEEPELGQKAS
jgi:hypothetical protein